MQYADAGTIYESIKSACTDFGIDLAKQLVSAAADGASVNFGHANGILAKLERGTPCPWLIPIHCVAHRLELAMSDAFKGTYFTQVLEN